MSHTDLLPRFYRHDYDEREAEQLCERVAALRFGGLSYAGIATALAVYEMMCISENEARSWCGRLGLPINPNKARPRAVAA